MARGVFGFSRSRGIVETLPAKPVVVEVVPRVGDVGLDQKIDDLGEHGETLVDHINEGKVFERWQVGDETEESGPMLPVPNVLKLELRALVTGESLAQYLRRPLLVDRCARDDEDRLRRIEQVVAGEAGFIEIDCARRHGADDRASAGAYVVLYPPLWGPYRALTTSRPCRIFGRTRIGPPRLPCG